MSGFELAVVASAVFFAAFVQVISGFGFGLLAMPVMTLAIPAKDAVVIGTLIGIVVSGWQAWHGRRHAERTVWRRMVIGAYAGMPIGLWVFVVVDDRTLRLALGVTVLVAVGLLIARIDLRHTGAALDVGAGFASGVLNTSLSTNGPPLVFALQARHLSPDVFRGSISRVFALSNVMALALFLAAGKVTSDGLFAAAAATPAMLLGQAAGYPLRRHVSVERFRWLVLVLLVAAATSAIVSALK